MPVEESKEYSLAAQQLETLADGVQIHVKEKGFPGDLTEQDVRNMKKQLEDVRQVFEKAHAEAEQKHEAYEALLKQAEKKVADAQRMLQGHHGLYSELLKDYGFQPPKKGGRKGKEPPK